MNANKGKAKRAAAAEPSEMRVLKAGTPQSAAHQRITDNANTKAKRMSVLAVDRLQRQFTRSMRQVQGGGPTQAPVEGADAGNDTITSCSAFESGTPSPSGRS